MSYGSTMKISSNLDQLSKKYVGFLMNHVQLLSALLVVLSVGRRGEYPVAELPWLAFIPVVPGTAVSRRFQQYSRADYFFQEGLSWPWIFELTINRWGSFRTGCVLQHLASDCLTHRYSWQLKWYKTDYSFYSGCIFMGTHTHKN